MDQESKMAVSRNMREFQMRRIMQEDFQFMDHVWPMDKYGSYPSTPEGLMMVQNIQDAVCRALNLPERGLLSPDDINDPGE
jgi:hypothetical protein